MVAKPRARRRTRGGRGGGCSETEQLRRRAPRPTTTMRRPRRMSLPSHHGGPGYGPNYEDPHSL